MKKKEPVITSGIYLYNTISKKILICHATHSSWKLWSIPKGLKNPGEDTFKSACRELKEEAGIDIAELNVLKSVELPPVKYQKQNKILIPFLVITNSNPDNYHCHCISLVNYTYPEIDGWKWVSPGKIKSSLHESQQKNLSKIKELIKTHSANNN